MIKKKKNIKNVKLLFIIIIFLIFSFNILKSQESNTHPLYPSKENRSEFEVNKIVFIGNFHFSEYELQKIIRSKATERSWLHLALNYYSYYLSSNKPVRNFLPKMFFHTLNSAKKEMLAEIQYFDKYKVEQDVIIIKNYYNMHGFHLADVSFSFLPDTIVHINILAFHIREDSTSKISSIVYYGLDKLDNDVIEKVNKIKKIEPNLAYNENELMSEVWSLQNLLQNEGYFYSQFEMPKIFSDSIKFTDSIVIKFEPGRRMRIGSIAFKDDTRGQNLIVDEMKTKLLEFSVGDWYSKIKIEKSINNLYSLGTFDNVTIDTISQSRGMPDNSLALLVFTQYRKQQEWGFSILTNYYQEEKTWNAGFDVTYFHRNLGGIGQIFNPYARFLFKDLSRTLSEHKKIEYELQIGIIFSQPLLFIWEGSRFGLSLEPYFSIRTINNSLLLQSISMPFRLPIKLPKVTYFNYASIDLKVDWEKPLNLDSAKNKELSNSKSPLDSLKINEGFGLYNILQKRIYSPGSGWPTSNILGGAIIGDLRNNPFSPTNGYYTSLSIDGICPFFLWSNELKGAANYARIQFIDLRFFSISDKSVIALKNKFGVLFWFDKQNSYVPIEKQFFAGGANSVRGWASRTLRYPRLEYYGYSDSTDIKNWISDFMGSMSLVEGSMEFRYKFSSEIIYSSDFIKQQLSFMGITCFIDWGNTFNWFGETDSSSYKYKWYEYISRLAVAAGLGLRYETPVGPFRIDFAWKIFDPVNQSIFSRERALLDPAFHIGLGHAF